jgi:hypothetical protein
MSGLSILVTVADIGADANLFQFKSGGNASGVNGSLNSVSRWEPCFAGVLVVWQPSASRKGEPKYIVVDGHQRLDLAKRLRISEVRCHMLREADGWPVSRARAYGAAKNIAEGGETTDALAVAKLIRADSEVDEWFGAVPSGRKCLKHGSVIARVSSAVFEAFLYNDISADYAAAIASGLDTEEHQLAAIRYLVNHPPSVQTRPDFLVGQIRAASFRAVSQETLFGQLSAASANMEYRAMVLEATVKHLRAVKRAFRTVVAFDGTLTEVGNKLASRTNRREREENEALADEIVQLVTFPSVFASLLREAAERLETGEEMEQVVRAFVAEVRKVPRRKGRKRKAA